MVAGFFTREVVARASTDRIWKAGALEYQNLLPKLLPDFVVSGELVEGNGGAGSVKKLSFREGKHIFRFVKERVEVLDRKNYRVKLVVIEGGLLGLRVKAFSTECQLVTGRDGETIGKIRVEYDTLGDTPLTSEEEEKITLGMFAMFKAVDGYLIKNPTSYA